MLGTSKNIWGFDPRSVPGCQLWLDGADQGSLTLSGSSVTQWNDKSGNGLTVSAASSQPTYVTNGLNGLGTLAFNGSQGLSAGSVTAGKLLGTTGTSATFCVFSVSDNTAGSCPISWDDSSYTYRFIISWESSGIIFDLGDASAGVANRRITIPSSSITFANNTYYLISFWQSGGSAVLNVNGGAYTVTTSSGFTGNIPTSTSRTFNIGTYINTSTYNLKGNIAEILVYNTHLPSNFKQVEGYLAHKWGLTGYYDSSIPLTIPGCALWLDGADSSTIAFSSGSNISSWADKSGNGRNATVYNGTPTYTVASGMTFNGSSALQVTYNASPTVESLFVIIRFNSVSAQSDIFSGTTHGQREYLMYSPYSPGTMYLGRYGSAPSGAINGGTVTTGTNYMLGYVFNGTDNTISFFQSGTTITSGTPQFTYSSGGTISLIGSYGAGGFLQGQIYEMIVYNSALTTTQRQTIEGYLAKKWGFTSMYSALPSTHPFSSIRPHLRTFQPIDVPGCQLWLDAADASTVTGTTSVTQWQDKSGNARHLGVGSGTTSYSSNAIVLNSSYMFVNSPVNLTNVTVFIISKSTGVTNQILLGAKPNTDYVYNSVDGFGFYNDPPTGRIRFYGQGNDSMQSIFFTDTSTPKLYSFQSTGTTVSGWLNGTSQSGGTLTTTRTSTAQGFAIGAEWGGSSYQNILVTASIYEIIVYNTALTTSERQQVEGYLAHKWGLTLSLPVISPLSIPGCQLWLDGSDQSSMTLSGSSITQLRDKSGNGNHMVSNGTSPLYNSSLINSVGGIDCTNGGALISSEIQNSANISFAMVAVVKSGIRNWGSFFTHGDRDYDFAVERQENTSSINFQTANDNSSCTITFTLDAPVLYFGTMTSGTSRFFESFSGGTNTTTTGTNSSTISLGSKIIRVGKSDNNNEPCNSFIGEIIYYTTVLTTTQRQQIEGYLARKWGISISATLPSPHPFRSIPPASLPFSPRNISGLQLWLDAADQGSMTLSGSNVTQWDDKSGNEKHATAGGTTPTYSSATRSIVFGGAGYFTNSSLSLPLSTRSVFIVCKQTSRAADFEGIMLLSSPSDGSIDYDSSTTIPYFASGSNVVVGDTAFSIYNRGTYVQNYRPYVLTPLGIYTDVFGSSSGTLYVNGTSNSTVADSSGLGTANGYILGARKFSGTTLSTFLNGTINEILVYNTALTTSQRQQVEGYLAHKWGLAGASSTPLSIPGCQLWLDGADPAGTGSLPANGATVSTWNDKSGNARNSPANSTGASFASNSLNGNGAMNFTSQGQYYVTPSFVPSSTNAPTIFLVAQQTGYTNGNSDIICAIVGSPPWATFDIFGSGGTFIARLDMYNNQGENGGISIASPVIISIVGSGAPSYSVSMFGNGTLNVTFTGDSGNPMSVSTGFNIGANAGFIGKIYEIIMYNTALSTTQRQTIESYLANKWGIGTSSSSFPSSHPYLKVPPA